MSTETSPMVIDGLKLVIEQMRSGMPLDREAARKALDRLTNDREELRKQIGTVNLVREARNQ